MKSWERHMDEEEVRAGAQERRIMASNERTEEAVTKAQVITAFHKELLKSFSKEEAFQLTLEYQRETLRYGKEAP